MMIVPAKTLPADPLTAHAIGKFVELTPMGSKYPELEDCQLDRVLSSVTLKLGDPSAVLIVVPTGMVAGRLLENRENVTMPVDGVAGSRVWPKSNIQESRSVPWDVDARVVCKTCKRSHCSHRTTDALASNIARTTDPTETSIRAVLEL